MSGASELHRALEALDRENGRSPDAADLVAWVDDVAPEAATPPELLALTVGRAYGVAVAERDQARGVADGLAVKLAAAMDHLRTVLELVPPSSFASANDDVAKARAWLDDLVAGSPVDCARSPEQEGQP